MLAGIYYVTVCYYALYNKLCYAAIYHHIIVCYVLCMILYTMIYCYILWSHATRFCTTLCWIPWYCLQLYFAVFPWKFRYTEFILFFFSLHFIYLFENCWHSNLVIISRWSCSTERPCWWFIRIVVVIHLLRLNSLQNAFSKRLMKLTRNFWRRRDYNIKKQL
jgi:hypothetical protein